MREQKKDNRIASSITYCEYRLTTDLAMKSAWKQSNIHCIIAGPVPGATSF